jgi:hypothetical protein
MTVVRVERVPPGHTVTAPRAGDFLLVRSAGRAAPLIHAVQWLRFFRAEDRPYRHWSHAAFVTTNTGRLVEVVETGVRAQSLRKYDAVEYHYVRLDAADAARRAAVAFAESCVGQPYDVLGFLTLGLSALVGRRLSVSRGTGHHCVSLVAAALARMSQSFERDPLDMMPGDLAKHYGITP